MKTSRWVLASLLVACGGPQAEPETADDAVEVADESTDTLFAAPECPPDPCAGPEATPEDALARAASLAREHLWADSGGEGGPPESSQPSVEWAQPPAQLPGSGFDLVGAILARGAEAPGGDHGHAAYLAVHAQLGWYVCEIETMRARGAELVASVEAPPASQELMRGVPGVTLAVTFRASRIGEGTVEAVTRERLAVCGATDRPVCFGVVPVADISAAVSEAQTGATRRRLEATFDGEGSLALRDTTGEGDPLAGTYPIDSLRCALREARGPR